MSTKIEIWLVGNTGLRNPNRIQDGFAIFANSPYVGNLRGRDNEIGFMRLLDEKGIIQNTPYQKQVRRYIHLRLDFLSRKSQMVFWCLL